MRFVASSRFRVGTAWRAGRAEAVQRLTRGGVRLSGVRNLVDHLPAAQGANDTSVLPLPPAGSNGLSLRPLGGDSSGGAARLRAQGRRTVYSVQLSRAAAGHAYAGEIRLGVCAQPGPSLTSLNPAVVDSAGRGAAAGDVAVPLDSLLSSAHVLVYGRGGRPEVCGEIRPGAPAPAPTADSARS